MLKQNSIGILTTYWSWKVIRYINLSVVLEIYEIAETGQLGTLKDSGQIAENANDNAEMFNETFCSVFMIIF